MTFFFSAYSMAFSSNRWKYQTAEENNGNRYYGYVATYSGAGSVQVSLSLE